MRTPRVVTACMMALTLAAIVKADDSCRYMKSRGGLSGYEIGGPFKLEHFHLTKGRTDLREFLWKHWHNHIKGVAEAKVATVDAGIVTALYVIQPNAKGQWGIDIELDRPAMIVARRRTNSTGQGMKQVRPPRCSAFHADSLARVPIRKPDEDYPSQTLGPYWPDRTVPKSVRMPDSEVKDAKYYTVILIANEKAVGDTI